MGRLVGGQSGRPLKAVMLERLMDGGTWISREALAKGASTSAHAIDDALADLVLERKAEWRQGSGYRLAGTEMPRAAVKQLRADGLARSVCGRQVKNDYRVGVAEQRKDLGLVMFELALPMPAEGPDHLRLHLLQVDEILKFTKEGEANG